MPFDPALTCINYNDEVDKSEKPFACPECNKIFTQRSIFNEHMEMHAEQKPFKCEYCDKSFAAKSYLAKHEKIHSKCHTCFCGKEFGQRKHYLQHLVTHNNEKPYKCNTCKKSFNQKGHLKRHKIVHVSRVKQPQVNPEFCECTICGKTFAHKVSLKRHMLGHEGEKHFPCPNCDSKFVRNDILQQHIKLVHLGVKEFTCNYCKLSFGHKGNLVKHVKMVHAGETKSTVIEKEDASDDWMMKNLEGNVKSKKKKRAKKEKELSKSQAPENVCQIFLREPKHIEHLYFKHESVEIVDSLAMERDVLELCDDDVENKDETGENDISFGTTCENMVLI